MSIRILDDKCVGCKACVSACPFGAVTVLNKKARIDKLKCNLCGACVDACEKFQAIELIYNEKHTIDKSKHRGLWVVAEQNCGKIANITLELLGEGKKLAQELDEPLCSILCGDNMEQAANDLICYGADIVYWAQSSQLKLFLEDTYTQVITGLIKEQKPNIVLIGATSAGRSLAPKIAARMETGLTADCTCFEIDPETKNLLQIRPAFGGNLMAAIICPNHRPQMATVRPKVFKPAEFDKLRTGKIIKYDYSRQNFTQRAELLDVIVQTTETSNLAEADIVVAAGKGLQNLRNIELIEQLADALGGVVGASRAVVEAGWISYAHQVGQTGKTVRPKLYIACGISGAVQHLVGMQSSETVVAINKDSNAPIFRVADYGIVGNVLEVVPILTDQIKTIYAKKEKSIKKQSSAEFDVADYSDGQDHINNIPDTCDKTKIQTKEEDALIVN